MTNPLEELIAATINRLAFERVTVESNPVEFAKQLANSLTFASWEQLAQVTGASTQFDNDGQLVLYTGCYQKAAEPTEEDELRDELDARDELKALKFNISR